MHNGNARITSACCHDLYQGRSRSSTAKDSHAQREEIMDKESCEELYARQELIHECEDDDEPDPANHVQQTACIGMMIT